MTQQNLLLAVLARSFPPATKWAGRVLHPSALMMPAPPLTPRSLMSTDQAGVETWFVASTVLTLHPGDAGNMRRNLEMEVARIWISLRDADDPAKVAVHALSADPFEGEAMATDPGLTVAALPMPAALRAHIAAYAALFPDHEPFRKKKRSGIEAEDPGLKAPRILPGGYQPSAGRRRRGDDDGERA